MAIPELSADKNEYRPGEVANIEGMNFKPSTSYDLYVFRGDGWLVKSNGESGFDIVVADSDGTFYYAYPLESIAGEYTVLVFETSDIYAENLLSMTSFLNSAPTISSDKADYGPEETAIISGQGFNSDKLVDILIVRPDDSIIKGDGTFTEGFDSLTIDSDGKFTYSYILNGIPGDYRVNVYDSADNSHSHLLATTSFADSLVSNYAGTATSVSGTITNAQGSVDGNCASTITNNAEIAFTNFGFSIPTGSTINSITVETDAGRSTNPQFKAQLLKAGVLTGSSINYNVANPADCSGTTFVTVPSTTLWGTTWTASDINNAGFGVSITTLGSGTKYIDRVKITIDYAPSNSGKISGLKFNDLNDNGIKDGGEPALSGWTINLHNSATNAIITSVATNASGLYQFSDLAADTYEITETLQSGWIQTKPLSPSNYTIVVTSATNSQNNDFGNFKLGEISGIKYDDSNGNSVQEIGESTLSGWNITMTGPISDSVLTDGAGKYKFTGLTNGTYAVSEVQQSGWIQTSTPTSYSIGITSGSNSTNNDFGNFRLVTISGQKFEDNNGDGIKNGADAGIAGWQIQLLNATDDSQIGSDAITDVNGNYNFTNIGPGSYKIVEVVQSGWTMTFPANGTYLITTSSGQNVTGKDFGNFENIAISGMKFEDHDGNGKKDGIDQGLAGWTINLSNGTTTVATDVTDASGNYSFIDLPPGTYTVTETNQAGWTQTTPNPASIVASSGVNSTNNDFGNFKNVGISGMKFEDENGDSDKTGDSGLANWTIELRNATNHLVASTTTNATGHYSFADMGPGTYNVTEVQQAGWMQTYPISGFYLVPVTSGDDVVDKDFGNFKLGQISGIKYNDVNANGVHDLGEPVLSDWNITLTGPVSGSMLTDTNGQYNFTGLTNGTYTVAEELESGWIQTSLPSMHTVDISSGSKVGNKDFGNFKLGEISGMKFDDKNANGLLDIDEDPIADWNITLTGPITTFTLTDGDGNYKFTGLINGTYTVAEIVPAGWNQTSSPVSFVVDVTSGTNSTNNDFGNFKLGEISGIKYEDVNANGVQDFGESVLSGWNITLTGPTSSSMLTGVSGEYKFTGLGNGTYVVAEFAQPGWIQTSSPATYLINITSGINSTNNNFGNFELGEISGTKYEDKNGNGVRDNGEPILSGWNITLTGPTNNSTLTDSNGQYKFTALPNGTYTVSEGLQSGWIQTSTPTSHIVHITSGVNSTDNDFGNFKLGEISGIKYEDVNANGVQDLGEPVLQGWNITLSGPVSNTTLTGADGSYKFKGLINGTYTVAEIIQSGWAQITPAGAYTVDITSGANATDRNFGNFELGEISGLKFEDVNANGVQDGGEPAIEGWNITLTGPINNSTLTDSNGLYKFTGLTNGTYTIGEIINDGWTQITTPSSYEVDVTSGTNSTNNIFGNFKLGQISGIKYNDVNANGVHDSGESALQGWNITLSGPVSDSVLTDTNGQYNFTGLINGTYTVSEISQSGWIQISPSTPYVIEIISGVNATDKDFGNFRLISISGMKFNDTNGSNSKDPNETGLSGWTIRLYNATSNTLITSTVTNNTGHYAFEGLGPGQYAIREVIQPGWVQTTPNPSNITSVSGQNVTNVNFGNFRLPVSQVTSSSLGVTGFDMDPSEPDQDFRLILTHDPKNPVAYKLTASNPGQTYYNVFYIGTPGTDFVVTMKIPYPYVTQGSQPIQLHDGLSIVSGSYVPGPTVPSTISGSKSAGGPITTITPSGALGIAIGDYDASPTLGDTQVTIVVSGEVPSSGIAYVTIHLDYGLKGTGNYGKGSNNNVVIYSTTTVVIPQHADHNFNAVTPTNSSSPIVYNINIFKHDPGFVGVVTSTSSGETIKGAKIQVYTSAGKLVGTAYTDENGYYQYYYKYAGKSTTFIVKLVEYSQQQSVTLKSNGFALAYFQIP
jgi:protocatechuate 3,4-dioxygenase beta subunit